MLSFGLYSIMEGTFNQRINQTDVSHAKTYKMTKHSKNDLCLTVWYNNVVAFRHLWPLRGPQDQYNPWIHLSSTSLGKDIYIQVYTFSSLQFEIILQIISCHFNWKGEDFDWDEEKKANTSTDFHRYREMGTSKNIFCAKKNCFHIVKLNVNRNLFRCRTVFLNRWKL